MLDSTTGVFIDFREIESVFEELFDLVHKKCLNEDNYDRIESNLNLLQNLIVLEKEINHEIECVKKKALRINKLLEEVENIEIDIDD